MSAKPVASWKVPLLVAAVSFVAQLWLFQPLLADFAPTLDEIAMQAGSTDVGGAIHPSDWFTQGLHGYFVPYPEWSASATDFWRPLANGWYWLNHRLSDDHWGNQLVLGYLAHALAAGLACYIAARILGLSGVLLAAAALIAIFNPAYVFHSVNDPFAIPRASQFPVYQIEVIAALPMMAAILAFLRRRYVLFSLAATVALLFKETALALPVAALLLLLGWPRAHKRAAPRDTLWVALPLLIWSLGRLVAYFHGATHLLPAAGLKAWLTKPLRNLLLWPTGLHQEALSVTRAAASAHQWSTVLRHAAAVLADLAWWAALAVAVVAAVRLWHQRRPNEEPEPWIVLLVFALGNLIWAVLLPASELRFGYLWFAIGPAAIFAGLSRRRWANAGAIALTLSLIVPQLYSLTAAFSAEPLQAYRIAKQSARQLTALLARLPATTKTVYLVDDLVVQSSSPRYFAKFAGFGGEIVLVNNLAPVRGCTATTTAMPARRYRLSRDSVTTTLDYQAPECFERAWNVAPLDQIDSGRFVQRGRWMNYHFPELKTRTPWLSADHFDYDAGRHWTLRVTDPTCTLPGACVWLGFDPIGQRYYVLED